MAMKVNSLEKLFVSTLKDLYDAEHQLMEALPQMEEAATSRDLKTGFRQHLKQTENQAKRLEKIFESAGVKPARKKCMGMEGLIKEGKHHITELKEDKDVLDAGLIAAAQKVEHYEIAGYGTAKAYAEQLGNQDAVRLLDEILSEECATDERLTRMAEAHINAEAM